MVKRISIYFLISCIMAGIYYFLVRNLIFTGITFIFYFLLLLLGVDKKFKKYSLIKRKTKECVSFINNFVITMSINNSITTTLNSLNSGFSEDLCEQFSLISHLTDDEKIFYLENYFESPVYNVFCNLLRQFLDEGGDILDSSRMLIYDSQLMNEKLDNFLSTSRNKIFQFCYMWLICFGILLAVQLFMGEYYSKIQAMNYFPYGILAFFILFGISLFLVLAHAFNLDFINREIKYEKS